ncbi:hypothetical protein PAMP_003067 [Pampus punctatissimus]
MGGDSLFVYSAEQQSNTFFLLNVKQWNKVVRKLSTLTGYPKTSAHPRCLAYLLLALSPSHQLTLRLCSPLTLLGPVTLSSVSALSLYKESFCICCSLFDLAALSTRQTDSTLIHRSHQSRIPRERADRGQRKKYVLQNLVKPQGASQAVGTVRSGLSSSQLNQILSLLCNVVSSWLTVDFEVANLRHHHCVHVVGCLSKKSSSLALGHLKPWALCAVGLCGSHDLRD